MPGKRNKTGHLLDDPLPRSKCPATWDGLNCWPETSAGTISSRQCPQHIYFLEFEPVCTGQMQKTCHLNGSWFVRPHDNHEWTNYTNCRDLPVSDQDACNGMICFVCCNFSLTLSDTNLADISYKDDHSINMAHYLRSDRGSSVVRLEPYAKPWS